LESIPVRPEKTEVPTILKEAFYAGLFCGKICGPLSSTTQNTLYACSNLRSQIAKRHPGPTRIEDEIPCSAHGLRTLDPFVQKYIGNRAALDIGAFIGDSSVTLIDYAKEVYSFEPGPMNFGKLVDVIAHNRNHTGMAYPVNLALGDGLGKLPFNDVISSMAKFDIHGVEVNITTVDLFVETHDIRAGFVKCHTEGHGLPILRGAERTLKKHRPVVSFSIFHNFDEFRGIPTLLATWLPNYRFWSEFGANSIGRWQELIFIGYPCEIHMPSQTV
jgi:FkbM family methyltransferase